MKLTKRVFESKKFDICFFFFKEKYKFVSFLLDGQGKLKIYYQYNKRSNDGQKREDWVTNYVIVRLNLISINLSQQANLIIV